MGVAHPPKAYVLLLQPEGYPESWTLTELWDQAKAIPGVTAVLDRGGSLARAFDAKTSGQVFLFRPDGALAFAGGITASRGHDGESRGLHAVEDFLLDGKMQTGHTPVFGCSLVNAAGTRS